MKESCHNTRVSSQKHTLHITGWQRLIGCPISKWTSETSDPAKKGGERGDCDQQSVGALVRLKPLRLPRAKLQVIFRKRAINYRALLRKIIYEDKASYDSMPPCTYEVAIAHMNDTVPDKMPSRGHIWTSHVTYMNEKWVMLHIWLSHVTCYTFECTMSQIWMGHVTHVNKTHLRWNFWVPDRMPSFGSNNISIGTWPYFCVPWLIYVCDTTHVCVWHDSSIRVTRLIHMRDMTHSHVWQGSFIFVMSHLHVCHDSFMYGHSECSQLSCVTWLIHMAHPHAGHLTHMWDTCSTPQTEEIGLNRKFHHLFSNSDGQNVQQVFTGVPIHIKQVFTGVPNISNAFSRD